jgi:uncharacterized protein
MFSVQRILGRDADVCALLERSAQIGMDCVDALEKALHSPQREVPLAVLAEARRENKRITDQVADLLTGALVVAMEREDIEALAEALYKIPKTIEKFAERYRLSYKHVRDFDFSRQLILMGESVRSVFEMVQAFGQGAGLPEMKRLDIRIQRLESEADDVVLRFLEKVYEPDSPTLKGIILKDLIELNEKVVDRCRDVGGILARTMMKNS